MRRFLQIAVLSFVGAFTCAVLFVVALGWGLPPSDATYGLPLIKVLRDPFILGAIVLYGGAMGILTTPIAYYCLRGRRPVPCSIFVFAAVGIEIVLLTPRIGIVAFFGACIVLFGALLLCKFSMIRFFDAADAATSAGRRV
jgi:hypothetical protein